MIYRVYCFDEDGEEKLKDDYVDIDLYETYNEVRAKFPKLNLFEAKQMIEKSLSSDNYRYEVLSNRQLIS